VVVDSEMPNIERRLGLWKPGQPNLLTPLRRSLDRHGEADRQCRTQTSGPGLHGLLGGALNLGGAAARLPLTFLLKGDGDCLSTYAT